MATAASMRAVTHGDAWRDADLMGPSLVDSTGMIPQTIVDASARELACMLEQSADTRVRARLIAQRTQHDPQREVRFRFPGGECYKGATSLQFCAVFDAGAHAVRVAGVCECQVRRVAREQHVAVEHVRADKVRVCPVIIHVKLVDACRTESPLRAVERIWAHRDRRIGTFMHLPLLERTRGVVLDIGVRFYSRFVAKLFLRRVVLFQRTWRAYKRARRVALVTCILRAPHKRPVGLRMSDYLIKHFIAPFLFV